MPVTLDYASPKLRRPPRRRPGMLAALLAVASSIVIVAWSVRLAAEAHLALMVPTDCGTGRHDAEGKLATLVPWAIAVPAGAWLFSGGTRVTRLVCRCSLWSAILGWVVSQVFVAFRNSL